MKSKKEKTTLDSIIEKKLEEPEFRRHFERARLNRYIARIVRDARQNKGITQTELAKKVGTKQSAIARLESGNAVRISSLDLLQRIAHALELKLIINLDSNKLFKEKENEIIKSNQVGTNVFKSVFGDVNISSNLPCDINLKAITNVESIDVNGLLNELKNDTINKEERIYLH